MKITFPYKVVVKQLASSRYSDNCRPASWDRRREGVDVIDSHELGKIRLLSDGSQSPPGAGWTLILTSGDEQSGYRWTLYGLSREDASATAH